MWDYQILSWLNHWVAYSPATFHLALVLTDKVPWVLSALTLILLWFAGDQDDELEPGSPLFEHRRLVLLVVLSAVLSFVLARPIAAAAARPRPLVFFPLETPIDAAAWQSIVNALGADGAFPSDHAAFWMSLTAGIFVANRRWGWGAVLATVFFSALRVAVGYHYPSDILAGMALGLGVFALVYWARDKLIWLTNPTINLFSSYPYLAYPLAFFILLDLTQRMSFLFGILATVFGIEVKH